MSLAGAINVLFRWVGGGSGKMDWSLKNEKQVSSR